MIHIETNPEFQPAVEEQLVERAALAALNQQKASLDSDLTIVLTDDEQLQQLNREYLGIDAPTDVLSFPASEPDPETGSLYLGDILISIPRAVSQAEAAGHSPEAEVQLLVVHGVLHLVGHDHVEKKEKKMMWEAQANILEEIGLLGLDVHE